MLSKRAAVDMEALIASLMQMEDPITYLRAYLVQRRVPRQSMSVSRVVRSELQATPEGAHVAGRPSDR